ncbi:MAG: hypothetical protein HQL09_04745 [Nitrospirae bacterium]|nr:hypothetical protein [Nitrospirota bacterium]
MAERAKAESATTEQPKLAEELKKMEYEPLLPVEKKLIGWSIGLGTGLIFILYWVSVTFFPGGH